MRSAHRIRVLLAIESSTLREAVWRLWSSESDIEIVGEATRPRSICWLSPYQLQPTTEAFVATRQNRVLPTLSLVRDGELGLPLESCYAVASRGPGAAMSALIGEWIRRHASARQHGLACSVGFARVVVTCQ